MQTWLLLVFVVTAAVLLPALGVAVSLPVIVREGREHVTAMALEHNAGIVIKRLGGDAGFVACGAGQCAPLKSVLTDGARVLVPIEDLSVALNLESRFDKDRQLVTLESARRESGAFTGVPRVGSIVPNLCFTRLDGTPVSLDEFRGQRVLINSWGSW